MRQNNMADKPKSFEEFYYRAINDTYNIEKVIEFSDLNNQNIGKFEGEMFCPECRQAELYFVHRTSKRRAHLRRCPTTRHEKECSYNYEYATKKHVQEFIDSLSYDEVQDKLNSIINMLCREPQNSKGSDGKPTIRKPKVNPMLIPVKKKENNIFKSLRRKRLNTWIDEADSNELLVFYGKVKLKVAEKEKLVEGQEAYNYYVLEVYNPDNKGGWKFRTSLYRGKNKDVINEDDIYYIAIIGQVGKKEWQIDLTNINAVKFCKCTDFD
jgi:hypothetical protein